MVDSPTLLQCSVTFDEGHLGGWYKSFKSIIRLSVIGFFNQ
jgi:hypothetical protein